jgi:hypothetical protein
MKTVIAAAALVLAALSGAGAVAATAGPASAEVLVNADSGAIHLGQSMEAGVWYQQSSGGPTGYWAGVWSYPLHKWIFTSSGHATTTWKFWRVKPARPGEYATVHGTAYNGRSYRTVYYTAVKP